MSETRTVFDPFEGRSVEVSNRLVDRLRGKYASGPHLPNGKPEFGWRQFEAPPIQHEAASALEAKDAEITKLKSQLEEARAKAIEECAKIAETFAKNHGVQWGDRKRFELHHVQRAVRGAGDLIAEDIRALLSAPTEARPASPAPDKEGRE